VATPAEAANVVIGWFDFVRGVQVVDGEVQEQGAAAT
jgi:hypothetical protein